MKIILMVVLTGLLLFPTLTQAAEPTGSIGYKTVRFWQGLDSSRQLMYLMGALDVLLISCPDIATLGAIENVLNNRIRDRIIGPSDLLYISIDKIAVDFGSKTVFSSSTDVTPVVR
jgi:hypothetical protein